MAKQKLPTKLYTAEQAMALTNQLLVQNGYRIVSKTPETRYYVKGLDYKGSKIRLSTHRDHTPNPDVKMEIVFADEITIWADIQARLAKLGVKV